MIPSFIELKLRLSHYNRTSRCVWECSRFTRLTNGFSKKVEHHAYQVALHFMHYNFVRIHKTLRMTPATAAGVTDRLWTIQDIVSLLPAPVAKKRGPYKKRSF